MPQLARSEAEFQTLILTPEVEALTTVLNVQWICEYLGEPDLRRTWHSEGRVKTVSHVKGRESVPRSCPNQTFWRSSQLHFI